MLNTTGLRTLILSSLLAGALCFGYWKYRSMDVRAKALQRNEQTLEQVRQETRDLEIRLDQARARAKAMENDPVEAEAAARRIGRTVRSKTETVFHLDESHMPPAVPPAPAPAALEKGTPEAGLPAAPVASTPSGKP